MTTRKSMHFIHSVHSAAFLLRANNPVGIWYERARGTTNLRPVDMKRVLLKSLGEIIRERIEIWTTTTQHMLKWCHKLGAITRLWERRITKNKLNNVQEEFDADLKARKKLLAKHKWVVWDRYVERILDTSFEL